MEQERKFTVTIEDASEIKIISSEPEPEEPEDKGGEEECSPKDE